jgi:hypothetical protein
MTLFRQLSNSLRDHNPRGAIALTVFLSVLAHAPSAARAQASPHAVPQASSLLSSSTVSSSAPPVASQAVPQTSLAVYWKSGALTVRAENAPLAQVIQRISRATGMHLDGTEKLQGIVTANLPGVPLRDGLAQLLIEWDYAFTEGDPSSSLARLPRLLILEPSRGNHAPPAATPAVVAAAPQAPRLGLNPRPGGRAPANGFTGDPATRDQHIAALKDAAGRGDLAALSQGMQDSDPEVQKAAFDQFFAIDSKGATEELISASRAEDSNIALQALSLLSQSQIDHAVVQSAYAAELDSADPSRKLYAVQLLSDIGGDAVDSLRQALADPDRTVRLSVVQNAARGDWGIPLLQQSLSDPDPQVRDMAQRLLQEAAAPPEADANAQVDEAPQDDSQQ